MLWHFMDFAQGLIQEVGIRIKQLMEQNLTIETKSNPNDLCYKCR